MEGSLHLRCGRSSTDQERRGRAASQDSTPPGAKPSHYTRLRREGALQPQRVHPGYLVYVVLTGITQLRFEPSGLLRQTPDQALTGRQALRLTVIDGIRVGILRIDRSPTLGDKHTDQVVEA